MGDIKKIMKENEDPEQIVKKLVEKVENNKDQQNQVQSLKDNSVSNDLLK